MFQTSLCFLREMKASKVVFHLLQQQKQLTRSNPDLASFFADSDFLLCAPLPSSHICSRTAVALRSNLQTLRKIHLRCSKPKLASFCRLLHHGFWLVVGCVLCCLRLAPVDCRLQLRYWRVLRGVSGGVQREQRHHSVDICAQLWGLVLRW